MDGDGVTEVVSGGVTVDDGVSEAVAVDDGVCVLVGVGGVYTYCSWYDGSAAPKPATST